MVYPLLPNTPFSEGDAFSPELAYFAFGAPIFDGQTQYLGHRDKLTDLELSDSSDALKSRVQTIEGSLKVSGSSGLTMAYASGIVRLPDGSQLSIASGLIAVADNETSYIWVDPAGAIVTGPTAPVSRLLLAKVVTVGGTVSQLTDLRAVSTRVVQPMAAAIKVFGGTNSTDEVATQSKVYDQGVYFFRNFTVPAGITVTVKQGCKFFCSGSVNILGTVVITTAAGGAFAFSSSASGINLGGVSGTGIGAGSGSGQGTSYPFILQPFGSGGGTGFMIGAGVSALGNGGSGGGNIWIEAFGPIVVGSSASITAQGGNATAPSITSTPSQVSGSGGGSGGLIYLASQVSIVCQAGSVLDVRGGTGSVGVNSAAGGANGGGGGGGGYFVAISPSVNLTGANLLLTGGLAGAGTSVTLGAGSGGGFGGQGGNSTQAGSVGQSIVRLYVPLGL